MELSGTIKMIGLTQDVNPSFRKREVVIATEEQYSQSVLIEFSQDKCDVLNNFKTGQRVKVFINIKGREWQDPKGETKYFNTIQGWKIELLY